MNIFAYALKKEIEGEKLYRTLSEKLTNPSFKLFFNWIADEEHKHFEAVKKLKAGNYLEVQVTKNDFHFSSTFLNSIEKDTKINLDSELDLIKEAYIEERNSYLFYLDNAQKTDSPKAAEIFNILASEEKTHEGMLKSILEHFHVKLDDMEHLLVEEFSEI